MRTWFCSLALLFLSSVGYAEAPRTVAETSDFKATSRHADVVAFCNRLAKESSLVRLAELGTSAEGRALPLVILADPPVSNPADAVRSGKLVVFAMANIHAGEVDGKEALLMLARDLVTSAERPLLKDLVIVLAPIFNADGNERLDPKNRQEQKGPEQGVGTRANAQGLDLNRDFVKMDSPEVRSLIRFLNRWDPAVVIDCHTTNGSYHRYTLTYEGGRCPAGDPGLISYVRDNLLPDVTQRLKKSTGYDSFFYGNFSRDRASWDTVLPTPRYGVHYVGLRGRIGILSESYSYAPFKDRVMASRGFVRSIFESVAQNKGDVRKRLEAARGGNATEVALRYKSAPLGNPPKILGYEEEIKDGKRLNTGRPKDYEIRYTGGTENILTVKKPWAYVVTGPTVRVTETLQRHGIQLEELREDLDLEVETYRVEKVTRGPEYQKHQPVTLEVKPSRGTKRIKAGSLVVKTAQPLGNLASFLLEPQSVDGLATWNYFDAEIAEGKDFPVVRLSQGPPMTTGAVRPLPEDRTAAKPILYRDAEGGRAPFALGGQTASVRSWIDADHYVQTKEGKTYKVHAETGRCEPTVAEDRSKIIQGFAALPTVGKSAAGRLAASARFDRGRTGVVVEHAGDLYHCSVEGKAVRLTKSPGRKELVTFSPNGQFVAFVRDNNLYVVDVASQTEKALTTDGSEVIFNGKADWVYFEEVFNRSYHAFWWSPDSTHLAFLRLDDTPVRKYPVLDHIPVASRLETTPYPKAGHPNPLAKLGVVAAAGGDVHFADLGQYTEADCLITRGGWMPDSSVAYFYVQNRTQTWLDLCTTPRDGGETQVLFRETTKAWVDEPGPLTFLKDGSFIMPSARTGFLHLYHFEKGGKLIRPLTTGRWEVATGLFQAPPIELLDEEGGWVYFQGNRDSATARNLYRARLDGSGVERLTRDPGSHNTLLSPKGKYFIDTFSSHTTPPRVRVVRADGTPVRWIDNNPAYSLEEYRLGANEIIPIKTPDGFLLETRLVKPANFDPSKKYPVWVKTYGGPHAPTVRDTWAGGSVADHALASLGFLVFHVDPRSACDKGAEATWTAYRQLGVQELKDLEAAVNALCLNPWADRTRVGISGSSYGGFMTAFALTHSKVFAAGVSSAPVTDWQNYDSVYTERYMSTPAENPEGYRKTSVVRAAANLHGKLLLVHGAMDDNVHVQNALQLAEALQRADKDFELMIYPRARHGGFGRHFSRLQVDFMKRVLKPEGS